MGSIPIARSITFYPYTTSQNQTVRHSYLLRLDGVRCADSPPRLVFFGSSDMGVIARRPLEWPSSMSRFQPPQTHMASEYALYSEAMEIRWRADYYRRTCYWGE